MDALENAVNTSLLIVNSPSYGHISLGILQYHQEIMRHFSMFTRDFSIGKASVGAYNKTNGGQYRVKEDFMEYKDFADAMTRLVAEHGKDVLLGGKAKAYISDYKEQFTKEAEDFVKLLKADCAKIINEADNILERKRQLVESMEEKLRISPKYSMPLLDLLGLLIKGDTSKCAEQDTNDFIDKGDDALVRGNEAEAVEWYRKAAEQGFALAQNVLDKLKAEGKI